MSTTSINDGVWHQIVLVYSRTGAVASLHIDGGAVDGELLDCRRDRAGALNTATERK